MSIANFIVGGLLLVLGRKLYWLFVAASGFVVGLYSATKILAVQPQWLAIVIALVFGIIGAVAAIVIQRIAISIAGFLAGAYSVVTLVGALDLERSPWFWIAIVAGGILGAILVAVVFDWAVILLSSLAGASAIMEGVHLPNPYAWLGLIVLCIIGVMIQAGIKRNETQRPEPQRQRA